MANISNKNKLIKKLKTSKNVPSWKLMPSVEDFDNPARKMRDLEDEIREQSFLGLTPYPEDYGFEEDYYEEY